MFLAFFLFRLNTSSALPGEEKSEHNRRQQSCQSAKGTRPGITSFLVGNDLIIQTYPPRFAIHFINSPTLLETKSI